MSAGKLWTIPTQVQGTRIRAVAAYGGLDIALAEGYEHGVTNKTPEYQAKFPSGKIPGFETASGEYLFETSAIGRYLAALAKNSTLLGSSVEEQAKIDQWISFGDSEIFAHSRTLNLLLTGKIPYNKPTDVFFREKILASINVLESHLYYNTYLVGERLTLADISVAAALKHAFERHVDAYERSQRRNTVRFYETIANNPKIKPVWGETAYAEKALQFVPPAKPKKEVRAAPPAVPKKEEVRPQKKKEDDDDDEDDAIKEEPKAKNPLDDLPKSQFNLDDWKRAYSNMKTPGEGAYNETYTYWLYMNEEPTKRFDTFKSDYSVWRVDFKYNEELKIVFMASNQIGGFFNRLEASRKYLFGSVGVLGEAGSLVISGVLILRGQDYKPVVEVAPDWESYEYKKLNLDDAADRTFFEKAIDWNLEIDGKKWVDGKNFK